MKLNDLEISFALYRRTTSLTEYGRRFTVQGGQGGDCENCHDQGGCMYLYLLETESDDWQPGMMQTKDGKYGKFKITGWPCPICNVEKINQAQEMLAKNCGLTGMEFEWSIDYCKGMGGKLKMIKMGKTLLKQIPLPSGFHTLHGGYGMGKSGLAKAMVAEMVKAGGNGMYRRAAEILLEARNTFSKVDELPNNSFAKTEAGTIHKYKMAQLLVVDEVDRTSKKEWSTSTIFTILDHRYNERDKLCTIVITNEHPDKLEPSFGYLASRMKDGYRIAVGGKELRG